MFPSHDIFEISIEESFFDWKDFVIHGDKHPPCVKILK